MIQSASCSCEFDLLLCCKLQSLSCFYCADVAICNFCGISINEKHFSAVVASCIGSHLKKLKAYSSNVKKLLQCAAFISPVVQKYKSKENPLYFKANCASPY